jgi:Tol biopolymer transport system component
MSLSSGTRLGPYEIVDAIGAGGMGEVYRARDTRLDRTVAIKILPAHLSDDAAARQRLEREAKAVSSLSHPHICALYDVGHEDGKDFLVMELLEGETLAARIDRGPISTEETLRFAIQIADALDKAHRQGVIHRDLKPSNVMLTTGGAKLLDFGLAKAGYGSKGGADVTAALTMTTPLTAEGTIVGTFQYMAPELLEGKEIDARSDIFAFGALLHEMITGRKAFDGQTQATLIASILKENPAPVSTLQPMAPPALDRLVQTCMAKDPDERRQSMHDVLLELRWIEQAGSEAGVPVPVAARRKSRSRLAWSTAAVLALATIALAVVTVRLASQPQRVVRAFIPPPPETTYALTGARPGPVAISPDGTKIAFVSEDPNGDRILWVRNVDALTGQPLSGTEAAVYPFWSFDSKTIAFFSGDKLKKIDAAGGPVLSLCDAINGKGGTWSADGTILFSPSHDAVIHRVAAAGGEPVPVTEFDEERKDNSHRFPWFLPDGEHFLYFARAGEGQQTSEESAVLVGSLDGTPSRVLLHNGSHAVYASGHLLFARENALMAQPFDTGSRETTGDAFPIADEVAELSGAARGAFAVSDTGVLVYHARGHQSVSELVWVDAEGKRLRKLGDPAEYETIALSPDGESVAVEIRDSDTGTGDLWVYDVERGIRTRFTFDAASDGNPVWSPDSKQIVFSSMREGVNNLYVNSVGGADAERPLFVNDQHKQPTDWTRDGRFIIYMEDSDIWALPMFDEQEPFPVIESDFFVANGKVSPDGRWLLYSSMESMQMEVYVTSFPKPGRKWQLSRDGGFNLGWRNDGKRIFYGWRDELHSVELDTDGGSVRIGTDNVMMKDSAIDDGDVAGDGNGGLVEIPIGAGDIVPLTLVVNWPTDLE